MLASTLSAPRALRLLAAFVRLGRPLFLGGGFILYGLGAAVARAHGQAIDLGAYLLGQGAVTSFQLMTHYANDYFDYEADCANATFTRWSGGSRVLPGGELPIKVALFAALALAAVGLILTGIIAATVSARPLVLATLLTMGLLSWAYSAPPLRLCGSGLGELDVAVVVTGLVPLLGFVLQAPSLRGLGALLASLLPLALLQVAMLLAIEFPDEQGDRAVGKRTLLVRIGATRAALLYPTLVLAAYLSLIATAGRWLPIPVALAAGTLFPLGLWRACRVLAGDHRQQGHFPAIAFWAVALLSLTGLAQLVAWLLLPLRR